MKALVLEGRTGLLGQALRHVLLGRGWSVESLERSDGDILDAGFLQARVEGCAPDVVFSSLGWNTVDDAEDHPDEVLLYNRTLPHTLACLLKTRGQGHLVHFSSGLVFSGRHGGPWREDDATAPLNVYGKTRLAGEKARKNGPGKRNFVDDILNACHRRDSITIVDDRTGSPTYSLDLALWSIMLAERGATGLWHAVNSGQATWCELACEAVGLAGNECRVEPIPSSQWPQKAPRPPYTVLDCGKLSEYLGMHPRPWTQARQFPAYSRRKRHGERDFPGEEEGPFPLPVGQ